jgi:hypothetical protein
VLLETAPGREAVAPCELAPRLVDTDFRRRRDALRAAFVVLEVGVERLLQLGPFR